MMRRSGDLASARALLGLAATLLPGVALASKGAPGVAEAVVIMIFVALVPLVLLAVGGGVVGAVKWKRKGESVLKGAALGVLMGILLWVGLCAMVSVIGTVAGGIFVVFAMLFAPT